MEKFQDINDVAAALAAAVTLSAKLESDPVVVQFRKVEEAAARHKVRLEVTADTFEVWGACSGGEKVLFTAVTVDALARWFQETYGEAV